MRMWMCVNCSYENKRDENRKSILIKMFTLSFSSSCSSFSISQSLNHFTLGKKIHKWFAISYFTVNLTLIRDGWASFSLETWIEFNLFYDLLPTEKLQLVIWIRVKALLDNNQILIGDYFFGCCISVTVYKSLN